MQDHKIIISAVDKTSQAFSSINSNLKSVTKGLVSMQGAIAATVGAAGLGAMVRNFADAGDKLQKLSIRLGASTEALSQYQHVAKLTGVEFDSLTTAWQRQTRRISEANQGTGEAVKALQELGLSTKDLINLRPEQQFEVLADALNGVSNQGDKVRLAMKFWDTEGVQLLQTIEGGSSALQAMRKEADLFGQTLTREEADSLAKFNDGLGRISAILAGVGQDIAIALAGPLGDFFNWLALSIPEGVLKAKRAFFGLKETVFSVGASVAKFFDISGLAAEFEVHANDAAASIRNINVELENLLRRPLDVGTITGGTQEKPAFTGDPIIPKFDKSILASSFEERIDYLKEHQRTVEETIRESQRRMAQIEEQNHRTRLNAASNFFNNLQAVASLRGTKGVKQMKRLAQANALIDAYKSANAAYSALAGIPVVGPGLAVVAGATALAAGIANVRAINKTPVSGAYDKGGFIPRGSVGLVGEVGPEFVQGPAMVTSRKKTAEMMNQPTVVVNINTTQSSFDNQSVNQIKSAIFRQLAFAAGRS